MTRVPPALQEFLDDLARRDTANKQLDATEGITDVDRCVRLADAVQELIDKVQEAIDRSPNAATRGDLNAGKSHLTSARHWILNAPFGLGKARRQ